MKLFLSWSGPRSRHVAEYLRQWLPDVIQSVKPWMSQADIDAGARWNHDIDRELSETRFGVICLTRENLAAPWILFEAGALAKTIADTFVCPYLIDLEPSEIPQGPLTQFQAKRAIERETWELVSTINKSLKEHSLPEDQLRRTFERWWPDLEKTIQSLPEQAVEPKPSRPVADMVEEILGVVRGLARRESLTNLSESTRTWFLHLPYEIEPHWLYQSKHHRSTEVDAALREVLRDHIVNNKSLRSYYDAIRRLLEESRITPTASTQGALPEDAGSSESDEPQTNTPGG